MVSAASLLGPRHLGEVVENKPASSLVVSLGKTLSATPHLYVEDRWPRHLGIGNSQASADVPSEIWRYNSLSREWRINMVNKIKKFHEIGYSLPSETACFTVLQHCSTNCSQALLQLRTDRLQRIRSVVYDK